MLHTAVRVSALALIYLVVTPITAYAQYAGTPTATWTSGTTIKTTGTITYGASDPTPTSVSMERWKWNGTAYVFNSTYNEPGYSIDLVNRKITLNDSHVTGSAGTWKIRVVTYHNATAVDDVFSNSVVINP